jgi:hypothetical protein
MARRQRHDMLASAVEERVRADEQRARPRLRIRAKAASTTGTDC